MIKPTFLRRVAIAALLSGSCFSVAAAPAAPPPVSYGVEEDVFHPVRAQQGMVASVDALATQVGVDILKQGGNAVDAAVAVGYALAVTHPQAGNLGGGGFMLLRTKDGNTTAIDFREMAPAGATRDMFLDEQGNADAKKSLTSHLASGTPGTVAGFSLALEKYGTMPLNKVVRPAMKLAEEGFVVNDALADDLKTYGSEVLPNHENSKAIFWKDGEPLKKGDKLVQTNLAKSLEVVNNAQKAYVEHFIQGDPDLAKLPVLSAAAPFKVGGRKNDPASFVEVEKGQLTFRNAADLYLYPNTLVVVKASGKEVKEWLECSAGQFNQIDIHSSKPQSLINWDGFRTYNFDVIDGVNYQIDVSQPARYDGECQTINPKAERIKNLTFNGKPIDPNATFLVATNNYRAYGGKFAGTGDNHIAFASPDENRSVLAAWIGAQTKRAGEIHPAADNNWRLAPIHSDTPLDIRFETSPSDKAAAFIKEKGQYPLKKVATDDIGFAIYQLDLSK